MLDEIGYIDASAQPLMDRFRLHIDDLQSATEMAAAIRLAGGFTLVASYGDFDADLPVEAPEAWRMILVLRRQ